MARIYISSTREELKNERDAAAKAVRWMEYQAICKKVSPIWNMRRLD